MWTFNERVSRWLFNWNALNFAAGVILQRGGKLSRAVGSQNIGWAVINIAIALFGSQGGRKRKAALADPSDVTVQTREKRNLTRILWINWGLDFLYIMGGARYATIGTRPSAWRVGTGLGIMLQGAFLLVFDSLLLRQLRGLTVSSDAAIGDQSVSSTFVDRSDAVQHHVASD
jgi:hypothetical protein